MKILAILITAVLSNLGSAARSDELYVIGIHAAWTLIDRSSVQRHGDLGTATTVTILATPESFPYGQIARRRRAKEEYDCPSGSFRTVSFQWIDGAGKVLDTSNMQLGWANAPIGSIAAKAISIVCDNLAADKREAVFLSEIEAQEAFYKSKRSN